MKKFSNIFSRLLIGLMGLLCLVGILYVSAFVWFLAPSNSRDNQDPAKQKEMMSLLLEWGRLSPFPTSAANISIKTEGNSFTRSFRASFTAPKQDIQSWIQNSPGLKETTPDELSSNKVQYIISPGGDANQAEVTIDYGLNQVEIYVSWS
jgi:hypothetical protein